MFVLHLKMGELHIGNFVQRERTKMLSLLLPMYN